MMEGDSRAPKKDLDWQFCQVFGEPHFEEVTEVDIVSAIEFDSTGEFLAAGDRGGRVVIFQRVEVHTPPSISFPSPFLALFFFGVGSSPALISSSMLR